MSLYNCIWSVLITTLPVTIISLIWADAPLVAPVPSSINLTVSPTLYPSPESIISIPSTTESAIEATLPYASWPPPPAMVTSSPIA